MRAARGRLDPIPQQAGGTRSSGATLPLGPGAQCIMDPLLLMCG